MVHDPGSVPTPNRVAVVDNRTCNVYSIPSAALKVPCASPAVIDMDDLQTLVETQQFSVGAVLKHVRGDGPHAFTDNHVGVVGHGANNAWVSRIRVRVPVAHPVVAACLRHETVEVQDEFRKNPPNNIHLGEELHWIWSQRLAFRSALHRTEARRKCDCPGCTTRYSHAIDAFPISMDVDNQHGAFDVASIPGAVLVPHSALPVGVRMILLTAAEPQPGSEPRETSTKRDGSTATPSWREETLKRIDSNAAVASDRLVAYCRANGVPPCVGSQMLIDANASYRAKTVALRLQERSRVALQDDIRMHVVELYNAHPTVFPHPKQKLDYGVDELDGHRKRGLATAWPACAGPSDSKRQHKEASVWLPEELWGRIFAMATADAMHEEASARATQHLRALSLTNRLGRSVVCSVVAAGVRAAAAAIVVCDQRRGEDALALLGVEASSSVQPIQTTTASATYAGVLFRNIGLPIDAVYWLLREDPTSQEQRAVQMLRNRDDDGKAYVWYLQWRKAKLSVYNGRVGPRVATGDAGTLAHRRLRWRGIEPADEEPEPKGVARVDAAPHNVRNDFLETVLAPFGMA